MIKRSAVRALLLDEPAGRLLLTRIHIPDRDECIWITPGGGIEAGETPDAALVREVREETGYQPTEWAGPVWARRQVFRFDGELFDQHETFYLVRTPQFAPDHGANPAEIEQRIFREFRWWSIEEIASSEEIFVPRLLASHLSDLLAAGCPDPPIEVGE